MIIRADTLVIMATQVLDVPDIMDTLIQGILVWAVDTLDWDIPELVADMRAKADTRALVAVTQVLVAVMRALVVTLVWADIRADTLAQELLTQRLATDTLELVADMLVTRTIAFHLQAVATRMPPQSQRTINTADTIIKLKM